jgi:hypothetical protein
MWLAHRQQCSMSWSLLLAIDEGRGKRDEVEEKTDEKGEERAMKWGKREHCAVLFFFFFLIFTRVII